MLEGDPQVGEAQVCDRGSRQGRDLGIAEGMLPPARRVGNWRMWANRQEDDGKQKN